MKRLVNVFSCLLCVVLLFSNIILVSALEKHFIAGGNVEISLVEYKKLKQVGLSEKSIFNLEYDEFKKIKSFNILSTIKDESYLKFICIDDKITCQNISKEMYDLELSERDIVEGTHGANSYAKLVITASYITSDSNRLNQFYVNVNINWTPQPPHFYNEVVGIVFADNVQANGIYIGDAQYPEFTAKLFYDVHHYEEDLTNMKVIDDYYSQTKTIDLKSNDYVYVIDRALLTRFSLPKDWDIDTLSARIKRKGYIDYYNYEVNLSGYFASKYHDIARTSFAGLYVHQGGTGTINWGNVTISSSEPYFSYSMSPGSNDPNFDLPLSKTVFLIL